MQYKIIYTVYIRRFNLNMNSKKDNITKNCIFENAKDINIVMHANRAKYA